MKTKKEILKMTTETCANCGHKERYHHTQGFGFPIKYRDVCKARGGEKWHINKCPCKKFVPQNQSQDNSQGTKEMREAKSNATSTTAPESNSRDKSLTANIRGEKKMHGRI